MRMPGQGWGGWVVPFSRFSPVMLLMLLFTLLISVPKGLRLTPFCCPFSQILSQQFQSERTYNLQPRDLRLVVN